MTPTGLSEEALQVWERGVGRPAAERAALALELTAPADRPAHPAALFARDAALLRLRTSLFGSMLDAVVRCPQCETEFDLPVDLAELAGKVPTGASVAVEADGFTATVRAPGPQDLLDLPLDQPPEAFAGAVFRRCVEQATQHGHPVAPSALPPAVRAAAAAELSAQRMEGPSIDLACGVCGHEWRAPIDIESVLWRDIDAWAVRRLDEVHRLAAAYHWSEHDILALPPARRRFYLEAIG
jgi:hypothetical protein